MNKTVHESVFGKPVTILSFSRLGETPSDQSAKAYGYGRPVRVDYEVSRLQEAGKSLIRLEPGPRDLQAIGYNMMDPGRRVQVFETALQTTAQAVAAL